jgi:hypothetical protein
MYHVGATTQCFHQAPVQTAPVQAKVQVSGQPVAVASNVLAPTGCPFTVGTKPQPCVTIKWNLQSVKVRIDGQPILLQPGPGSAPALGLSAEQTPQGAPIVTSVQMKVQAS